MLALSSSRRGFSPHFLTVIAFIAASASAMTVTHQQFHGKEGGDTKFALENSRPAVDPEGPVPLDKVPGSADPLRDGFDPVWTPYEEHLLEDPDAIPLNYSNFNLPSGLKAQVVDGVALQPPRLMLEFLADSNSVRDFPKGAEIVRSFPVLETLQLSPWQNAMKQRQNSLFEATEASELKFLSNSSSPSTKFDPPNSSLRAGKQTFLLVFDATFKKLESIRSAVLKVFALPSRHRDDIAGVERRIKVYWRRKRLKEHQDILAGKQDVYLLRNSWVTIDVTKAAHLWKSDSSSRQLLKVEISADFLCPGSQGALEIFSEANSLKSPFLLLYSSAKHKNRDLERHRPRRSLSPKEMEEEETNFIWDGDFGRISGLPPGVNAAKKLGKKARRRRAKNSCKKKSLTVNFNDIGWGHWVIGPMFYEAHQCNGKCFYPLPYHLSPTKHAIVQNLMHSLKPQEASRACCVPTKLGSISLLYREKGVVTYNKAYRDMVVLECGCR